MLGIRINVQNSSRKTYAAVEMAVLKVAPDSSFDDFEVTSMEQSRYGAAHCSYSKSNAKRPRYMFDKSEHLSGAGASGSDLMRSRHSLLRLVSTPDRAR